MNASPVAGTSQGWAMETMLLINKLTPDIQGKGFDPDWFLLRQRLEDMERRISEADARIARLESNCAAYREDIKEIERDAREAVREAASEARREAETGDPYGTY